MWGFIRRLLCPHDYSITSESGVMFLRCVACGHKTRGWPLHSGVDIDAHLTARSDIPSVTSSSVTSSVTLSSRQSTTLIASPSLNSALNASIKPSVSPSVNVSAGSSSIAPPVIASSATPSVRSPASPAVAPVRCRVLPGPHSKVIAQQGPATEAPKANVAIYACAGAPDDDGGQELAELRRYVEARGWSVRFEQVEQHQNRTARPALHRLIADARLHRMDRVVVRQLDRLARGSAQVVLLLDELTKLGVSVVSVGDGIDTITSDDRLQTRLVNALAALERVRKTDQVGSRRRARKHREPATRRLPFMESPLRLAVSSSTMPRDVNHTSEDGGTAKAADAVSHSREIEADAPSESGYQVR
ncbi:MAG: hypothetical protein DMF89_25240 [Acidobacteria bacterium]|nr:MAG: hypothetical protein DMF89_25240 [Acidobacteriota bacterium]